MTRMLPYLLFCGVVHANDALDVLEGRRKASEISLPPAAGGDIAAGPAAGARAVYKEPEWEPGPLDSVWSRAVLFEDASNPWIQQAAVTGFFNFQSAFGEADVDGSGATPAAKVDLDGSRTRRARLGSRLRMFRNTDIEASAEFAGDSQYERVERLSAETRLSPGIAVKYGKFRPTFTREYSTEDAHLPYPERSMLVNMVAPPSTLGVALRHTGDDWGYGVGWFSSDSHPDLPGVEGDGFVVLNFFRDHVVPAGTINRRIRFQLDYMHHFDAGSRFDLAGRMSANGDQLVAGNPSFRHLLAASVQIDQDRFLLASDVLFARGDQTAWGVTVSPAYWLVPGTLELVARYHHARSEDDGGLVSGIGAVADPAFGGSAFFTGNRFHSLYLGANLHLYQDEMVLMGGIEKISMDDDGAGFDVDASLWHAGAKVSF